MKQEQEASSVTPSEKPVSEDNHSMTDESKPVSQEKSQKEEEKKNENNESKKKPNNKGPKKAPKEAKAIQGPLKEPHFKDKFRTMRSNESGYVGNSEGWFDEELYKKPKGKANFDGANKHDYYFNSYSSHHIHEEMLKDTSRTLTYQRAIEGNPQDFKDKIVLDIGCGTGILSIFAARAGAKHVYAVDNAEIALFAQEIINENGLKDKITIIKGKMEEIEFPFGDGGVDIIISEWMGYFLLYESMLDCVLWARDKYLNKKTGKMLPDRAQLYVAAIEDSDYMGEKTTFWKNVYGVDMSVMT